MSASFFRSKLWFDNDPYVGLERPKKPLEFQGFQLRCPILGKEVRHRRPRFILEIGAHRGASACWMAECAPEAEILTIDTWALNCFCFKYPERMKRYATARDFFRACVLSRNLEHRITYLPMASDEAFELLSEKIPETRFDLAYVDGGHKYKQVAADLENARRVTQGPIIADDYEADRFPGVYKAVNEFALKHGLSITKGNRKAVLKRKDGKHAGENRQ